MECAPGFTTRMIVNQDVEEDMMNRVKLCDNVFKELFASESKHGEATQVANLDANMWGMVTITILEVYQQLDF